MQPHRTRLSGRRTQFRIEVLALSFLAGMVGAPSVSDAAVLTCSKGDVACLVAAINTANANGQVNTIRLAAGVYTLTAPDNETDGPNGLPSVTSTLTIIGVDAAVTAVERAADAPPFRIFRVSAEGVLRLRRMTIRGGLLPVLFAHRGAGVLSNGILHLSDSVITGNATSVRSNPDGGGVAGTTVTLIRTTIRGNPVGGGISVTGGNLTIRNSIIADNFANRAPGGILFSSSGRLTIVDTTITGNRNSDTGSVGVGIFGGAVASIRNSTIARNRGGGAAIGIVNSTVDIDHSAIVDNDGAAPIPGPNGGGISAFGGTLTVHESTIARNVVLRGGAALTVGGDVSATVTSSTITDNVARFDAGPTAPIGAIVGGGIEGNVRLENTILARNKGYIVSRDPSGVPTFGEVNCFRAITSLGHNLISDPGGCGDLQTSDTVGDPGLGDFIDPGRPGTVHYALRPAAWRSTGGATRCAAGGISRVSCGGSTATATRSAGATLAPSSSTR
jgi:hypothetical protein